MIKTIRFQFTGTRPLLIQSERTANPMDPIVKEIRKYTSKKPKDKTDADYVAIARLEFEAAFYNGTAFAAIGPYLPGLNIAACLRDAAKSQRKGATVVRAIEVLETEVPIKFKGPRVIADLWQKQEFVDIRGVKPTKGKVMRCRPIIRDWSMEATIEYEETMLNRSEIIDIAKYAGSYVGIGTFRPTFGRFKVTVKS